MGCHGGGNSAMLWLCPGDCALDEERAAKKYVVLGLRKGGKSVGLLEGSWHDSPERGAQTGRGVLGYEGAWLLWAL